MKYIFEEVALVTKSVIAKFAITAFDGKTYQCYYYVVNKNGYNFTNRLSFLVSDIVCESTGMLGTRSIPFEKLSPEKKPKHDEYLKEFINHNSMRLNDLFHFIRTNQLPAISHWNEIAEGKAVKGMNKPECLLAYGKPLDIKVTGSKEQWMYSSFNYLFFDNGVLDACVK